MYYMTVDYPRGRMMTFHELDYDSALMKFSDIVDDIDVYGYELISFDEDNREGELFSNLFKIFENRTRKVGFVRWLNDFSVPLKYYRDYQDPLELYDELEVFT